VQAILDNECNLDLKNPNGRATIEHLPPEQLIESIWQKERRILEIVEGIRHTLASEKSVG
jgi:type I restriction enzyme M protein